MEIDYVKLMAGKSNEGLSVYLDKIELYTEEAVTAAMVEFRRRGREFSESELVHIKSELAKKKQQAISDSTSDSGWSKYVVTDESAPLYFTQRAIWAFSAFVTPFFGAWLLAINLRDKGNVALMVVGFGLVYTIAGTVLLMYLPRNTAFSFGVNAAGGMFLLLLFWNKYIGKETRHRARPVWIPLFIACLLIIAFIGFVVAGE